MSIRWLAIAALVIVIASACGDDTEAAGPTTSSGLRVASFDFAESELLAELYAQALEAEGLEIRRLGAVGPREVVAPALELGRIDVVPEYLGTASGHFDVGAADTKALTAALQARDLVPLEASPAENANAVVVTGDFAVEHDLTAISDLVGLAPTLRFGGPVECQDRPLCLPGLGAEYGLAFAEFVPQRSLTVTAEALVRSEIEVGLMFSTAAELAEGPFVVLEDDRNLQPPENVIPLVRQDAVDRWGRRVTTPLNAVSGRLTTADLQDMNRQVEAGEPTEAVAAAWLESVALTGT